MRDLDNIKEVAACEPDYMGFIWVEKSPRYVGSDFVIPTLSAKTQAVGVFVNESVANILALSKKAGFQVVQLHGDEGQEEIDTLREAGLVVIKAVSVSSELDMLGLDLNPDYYLFDTKKGSQVGGTGEKFDWAKRVGRAGECGAPARWWKTRPQKVWPRIGRPSCGRRGFLPGFPCRSHRL